MSTPRRHMNRHARRSLLTASVAAVAIALAAGPAARADETDAKALVKAMSDYLGSQEMISFSYDSTLEVVTNEDQKLGLASSGAVTMHRPDRIRATRTGGFADVEMLFDGTTFTFVGKNENLYMQLAIPGTVDHLIDELRDTYGRPLPAADLLLSDPYGVLIADVTDIKDLGSGVIGGKECDWLAFRTAEVDWQIWIAQGEQPYPCRYVITTKQMPHAPQYTIEIRDWRTSADATSEDFAFTNPTGATEISLEELRKKVHDLPQHFSTGE